MHTFHPRGSVRGPFTFVLFLLLFLATIGSAAESPASKIRKVAEPVKDRYIVKLSPLTADVDKVARELAARYDGKVLAVWTSVLKGFWVEMGPANAAGLARDNRVVAVEEDAVLHASGAGIQKTGPNSGLPVHAKLPGDMSEEIENDPLWHLSRISHRQRVLPGSDSRLYEYRYSNDGQITSSSRVRVYVIDTGVTTDHAEFEGRRFGPSYNAAENPDYNRNPSDGPAVIADPLRPNPSANPCVTLGSAYPHGTAVASMVFGKNVGVAKGVELISIQTASCTGNPTIPIGMSAAVLLNALDHIRNDAYRPAVVSISTFRTVESSSAVTCRSNPGLCASSPELSILEAAFNSIVDAGIAIVASANNQDADACKGTPARLARRASLGKVITVGGIGPSDHRWTKTRTGDPSTGTEHGSNFGQCVDIWAPATHLLLAHPSAHSAYSAQHFGTSYAAPIVAGIVARMLAADPTLTPDEVWALLQTNGTKLDPVTSGLGLASPDLLVYLGGVTFDTVPRSQEVAPGQQVTLSASVLEAALVPPVSVSYQWYEGETGITSKPIPNEDGNPSTAGLDTDIRSNVLSYVAGPDSSTTKYWVRVTRTDLSCTGDPCAAGEYPYYADSLAATVAVTATPCVLPKITQQPKTRWLTGTSKESVVATVDPGGQTYYYRWQRLDPPPIPNEPVHEEGLSGTISTPGPITLYVTPRHDVTTYELRLCTTANCTGSCVLKSDTVQFRVCPALDQAGLTIRGADDQGIARLAWNGTSSTADKLNASGPDGVEKYRWLYRSLDSLPGTLEPLRISGLEGTRADENGGAPWMTYVEPSIVPPKPGYYAVRAANRCSSVDSGEVRVETTCQIFAWGKFAKGGLLTPPDLDASSPPVPYDSTTVLTAVVRVREGAADVQITWPDGSHGTTYTTPRITARQTFQAEVHDRTSGCKIFLRFTVVPDTIPSCDPPSLTLTDRLCGLPSSEPVYTVGKNVRLPMGPVIVSNVTGAPIPPETLNEYDYTWTTTIGGATSIRKGRGVGFLTHEHVTTSSGTVKLVISRPNGQLTCVLGELTYHIDIPAGAEACTPACTASCRRRAVRSSGVETRLISFTPGDHVTFSPPEGQVGEAYSWYRRAESVTAVIGTTATIDLVLQEPAEYWVVSRTASASVESDHLLTVLDTGSSNEVTVDPTYQSIVAGGAATITATFLRGEDANTEYEWRRGSTYDPSQPIIGRNRSLTLYSLQDDDMFWCRIIQGTQVFDSDFAMVTVSCTPSVGGSIQTTPAFVAKEQRPRLIAAGFGKLLTFNWSRSYPNDPTPVSEGSPYNVLYPEITQPVTYFSAEGTDACGNTGSFGTTTIYLCVPKIDVQPVAHTVVAPGQQVILGVAATPAVTGQALSVKWYRTSDVYSVTPLGQGWTFPVTLPAGTTSDSFYAVITANCGETTYPLKSQPAVIESCAYPILHSWPVHYDLTEPGTSARLAVAAEGTALTYQWYIGESGDISQPMLNKTNSFIDVSPTATTKYWCRVTSKGVCVTNTPTGVVEVCSTPAISVPPQSKKVFTNEAAVLSVTASAGTNPKPLTYQWQRETPLGTWSNISGATGHSYTTPAVTASMNYRVEVATGACKNMSAVANVAPCTFNSVVGGPSESRIASGGSATLSLPVLSPVVDKNVKWFRGVSGDPASMLLTSGVNISYVTGALTATTKYWAQFEYEGCVSRTDTYTVNVCIPTITVQPAGGQITLGGSHPLSVTTDITPVSYEWWAGPVGDHFASTLVPGGNTRTFDVSPTADTTYWVRIRGCGTSIIDSAGALVKVCRIPQVTSQTTNHWIAAGTTEDIRVDATGTTPSYQWYRGNVGDVSTPVGTNQAFLRITPTATVTHWAKVTNSCGTVSSAAITVSVCAPPSVTVTPASRTIFSGATAQFTATASVSTGTPLSYQWYSGTPASPSIISGATSNVYTTPALTAGASYFVRVTSGTCITDSTPVTVAICSYAAEVGGTTDKNIYAGQTTRLDLVISPVPSSYRWYRGLSGDTSTPLTGWQAQRYLDVNPSATTRYWAEFQGPDCASKTSTITVNVCVPVITQQPASDWVTPGGQKTLTVAADLPGVTYQWFSGTSGTGTAITGATSATYTTPALSAAANYWVRVTGSCGVPVNSNTAAITICQPPAINGEPGSTSVTRGTTVRLFVTATGNALTYQWYQGTSGSGTLLSGGAGGFLDVTPQTTTSYWVKVNGTCGSKNSQTATISVCDTPVISSQPQNTTIFSGGTAMFSVSASQPTGSPLAYQWHDAATGAAIPGATGFAYVTPALTSSKSYFVRVSSGGMVCWTDSAVATATICPYPEVAAIVANKNASPGQTTRLTAAIDPAPTAFRWYRGATGDRSNPLTGWVSTNYLDVNPTTTTQYWADFQNSTCQARTNTATVTVCVPAITQQPVSVYVSPNGAATFTVASNLPGTTYQWYQGTSGSGTAIGGATGASYTTPGLAANASYWVRLTGSCGVSVDSVTATATICAPPSIVYQPYHGGTGIPGRQASLEVTANGTNLAYQWYRGEPGDLSRPVTGQTTRIMTLTAYQTEKYWVRITGTCGTLNSSSAFISVRPTITSQPGSVSVDYGQTATFSVEANGAYLRYEWYNGAGQIVGTNATYTSPPITGDEMYRVLVYSGMMSEWSYEAYATLNQ